MKGFLQKILQETIKKKNAWNVRRLVNEMITNRPSNQAYYIEDCRISGAEMPSFARL